MKQFGEIPMKKIGLSIFLVLLLVFPAFAAQITIDDISNNDTPKKCMTDIDTNFTELYGFWTALGAAYNTSGELDTLFGGKQDTDAFLTDIAALTDPGADRILFWEDTAGDILFLTLGTNLSITGTTLNAAAGTIADDSLLEVKLDATNSPTNDYILSYDSSSGGFTWVVDATGTGGDQLVDIVATSPLLVNGTTNVDNVLPGSDSDVTFSIGTVDIGDNTNLAGTSNEIVLTGDTLSLHADITRDSELHTAATVSGTPDYITLSGQDIVRGTVDIGDDTNLAGTSNEIVLTGDTLSLHADIARDSELHAAVTETGDAIILSGQALSVHARLEAIADNSGTVDMSGLTLTLPTISSTDWVESDDYAPTSIDNEHLADDAVNSDELAGGAVDLAHMSVNSVDSGQYVDGSIDTAHIAGSQITNALMADSGEG